LKPGETNILGIGKLLEAMHAVDSAEMKDSIEENACGFEFKCFARLRAVFVFILIQTASNGFVHPTVTVILGCTGIFLWRGEVFGNPRMMLMMMMLVMMMLFWVNWICEGAKTRRRAGHLEDPNFLAQGAASRMARNPCTSGDPARTT
jgi:hypothetical protein